MQLAEELKKSALVSLWFMFLTFPIMVIRVNTIYNTVEWRWLNMALVGVGSFFLSMLWRFMIRRKQRAKKRAEIKDGAQLTLTQRLMQNRRVTLSGIVLVAIFAVIYPLVFSMYQTSILITALIYVMCGLGLNLVI